MVKEMKYAVDFQKMVQSPDLEALVLRLFSEIDQYVQVDGKIIDFFVAPGKLKIFKTQLFDDNQDLDSLYRGAELHIENYPSLNYSQKNKTAQNIQDCPGRPVSPAERKRLEIFDSKQEVVFPITHKNHDAIGFIHLQKKNGNLSSACIQEIEKLIEYYFFSLKDKWELHLYQKSQGKIKNGQERYQRLLSISSRLNKLYNEKKLYRFLIQELLEIFNYDLGFVQMEKNGTLPMVEGFAFSNDNNIILENLKEDYTREEDAFQIYPYMNENSGTCAIAFVNNTHFYVEDTAKLKKFKMLKKDRHALQIAGQSLQSFLMMPIRQENKVLGILQLWSFNKNISLSDTDIQLISHICSFIPSILENAVLHQQVHKQKSIIQEKNKQWRNDLEFAKNIQRKMLPELPDSTYDKLSFASFYRPMELVGGDFYDVIPFPEEKKVGIFIGDVCGHGVPSALMTTMLKALIETAEEKSLVPSELMYHLNEKFLNLSEHLYLTAFYAIYDEVSHELTYCQCGHPFPFLLRRREVKKLPGKTNVMLGFFDKVWFEEKTLQLEAGDKILFYTDGLLETFEKEGKEAVHGFQELIRSKSGQNIKNIFRESLLYLNQFQKDNHFNDDICMLGMEILY